MASSSTPDPVLHSPTRFFVSVEYKEEHVGQIIESGWHSWERERRAGNDEPVEVLIGGRKQSFLRYARFEREVLGEDQGHRQLVAEQPRQAIAAAARAPAGATPDRAQLHALAREFQLAESEVLDLIANARRLKMAVRGWVAEEHLVRTLRRVPGVSECARDDAEGHADVNLRYEGTPLTVECKNVLRRRATDNLPRLDFQRTRASKGDPCSRYYAPEDFDVVAACLHAVDERWSFRYAPSGILARHADCPGKLSHKVRIDSQWTAQAARVLADAADAKQ